MSKIVTLKELQQIAISRDGKCLSDKYLGAKEKLEWECAKGHKFLKTPNHIKRGQWCKFCNKYKYSVGAMKQIARKGAESFSQKNTKEVKFSMIGSVALAICGKLPRSLLFKENGVKSVLQDYRKEFV